MLFWFGLLLHATEAVAVLLVAVTDPMGCGYKEWCVSSVCLTRDALDKVYVVLQQYKTVAFSRLPADRCQSVATRAFILFY